MANPSDEIEVTFLLYQNNIAVDLRPYALGAPIFVYEWFKTLLYAAVRVPDGYYVEVENDMLLISTDTGEIDDLDGFGGVLKDVKDQIENIGFHFRDGLRKEVFILTSPL